MRMCKSNIWADVRDQRREDITWRASRPSCRKNRRKGWQDKVCNRECESDEGCTRGPEDPHTGRIQEYTYRARGNLQLDIGVSSWEGVWQSEDRSVTNEGTILKIPDQHVRPHSEESHCGKSHRWIKDSGGSLGVILHGDHNIDG